MVLKVIEISVGEYGDQAENLVKYIKNGKSTEWFKSNIQEISVSGQYKL